MATLNDRVLARLGFSLEKIPEGIAEDLLGGSIVCQDAIEYVVTFGYPDVHDEEDGEWTRPESYRRVKK